MEATTQKTHKIVKYFAGRRGGGYGVRWVGNMKVKVGEKRYEELQEEEECFIQLGLNKGIFFYFTSLLEEEKRIMALVKSTGDYSYGNHERMRMIE
ncbi:hypothetical protein C1H46_014097 [Malus baccata]|uniref:Uncharacterized protein n=1 Tax=Malus baccata TaxID=106549 RepID=A0A540MNB9_MALBA|nr:hypothetical protein C1H46_014097 [Malus baccata]